MVDISVPADLHIHIGRQRIYNRRTDTMQTSAGLVCRIVEFSARMKCRVYHTSCRYSCCMKVYRYTTSVICDRCRTVFFQCHMDLAAISGKMLIHRIIHNLIDQMVQTFGWNTSYIHSGSFSYRFQTFQNGNTWRIIIIVFCHEMELLINTLLS